MTVQDMVSRDGCALKSGQTRSFAFQPGISIDNASKTAIISCRIQWLVVWANFRRARVIAGDEQGNAKERNNMRIEKRGLRHG